MRSLDLLRLVQSSLERPARLERGQAGFHFRKIGVYPIAKRGLDRFGIEEGGDASPIEALDFMPW
ncbi:MAG: hypothetical protein ACF8AM_24120 [Rhodopirellula sp. JB055]|uniref:hypothetical protein n=1 Tax=Rhodopirellula sp. JB055 TaxID=3342846 RepID=UPI00370CAEE6